MLMVLIDILKDKKFRRVKDGEIFEIKVAERGKYIVLQNIKKGTNPIYEWYHKFLRNYEIFVD